MRIFLDMEKLKRPNSGLGQFCAHLGTEINQLSLEEIGFYVDETHTRFFDSKNTIIWKRKHQLLGVNVETDVWHCTHQEAKYFPKDKSVKILLTIHDLNFLDKYEGIKRTKKLKNLQKLVNKASGVVFISEFTKKTALYNLNIPQNIPQKVIYNGVSVSEIEAKKPSFIKDNISFLFTIGIVSEKKNFHVLVEAMKKLPQYTLFICGNKGSDYAVKIQGLITQYGLEKNIFLTGEIAESEKNWMYKNCKAFVFPSLNEGFGLPVVEAMYFGKPVILSKMTSLPEIAGDIATYLDNFSADDVSKKIILAIENHSPKNEKALQNRASCFSWRKAAEQYLKMYQLILRKTH